MAEPDPITARKQTRDSGRRFHRARHHQPAKIVRMVRAAGAKEVHLRISCPPTISPCYYGVDTPIQRELIAAVRTIDEIKNYVEADSLGYLSIERLREAVSDSTGHYCYACYTGKYPTPLVQIDELFLAKSLC